MDQKERDFIRQSAMRHMERESAPRTYDFSRFSDMTTREHLITLVKQSEKIESLERQLNEERREKAEIQAKLDKIISGQAEMMAPLEKILKSGSEKDKEIAKLSSKIDKLTSALVDANKSIEKLNKNLQEKNERIEMLEAQLKQLKVENGNLTEQHDLDTQNQFGSKSQKGGTKSKKQASDRSHQQDKDDFDGTPGSLPGGGRPSEPTGSDANGNSDADGEPQKKPRTPNQLKADIERTGSTYRRMKANLRVEHLSDERQLPPGAVVFDKSMMYVYDEKVVITEHAYQLLSYRLNGKAYTAYVPADGEPVLMDRVPGTHASSDFLAHLAFNRFALDTPLYREIKRLVDEGMILSRKTLTNWLCKGAKYLSGMVKELLMKALEKDSIINCDETWCRVRVYDHYHKKYIWCLVNKEAKIVIYCYEDGSRGRKVLKKIIGDADIKALQSDGYNVYLYLDDELVEVEHLCCMAHARAKFKYAFEKAGDKDAGYMLDCFGELYKLEAEYKKAGLNPEQIGKARRSTETLEIMGRMRSKLDVLTADDHPPRGDLMDKAVNYLKTFWKQLFRYRDDGRYSIDNNIAERNIRPLAGERKNSLFFGSHKMANASAAYHTALATCRMMGISGIEFLKTFFRKIVEGERDYTRLMPQTIG